MRLLHHNWHQTEKNLIARFIFSRCSLLSLTKTTFSPFTLPRNHRMTSATEINAYDSPSAICSSIQFEVTNPTVLVPQDHHTVTLIAHSNESFIRFMDFLKPASDQLSARNERNGTV
ncbi:hypothetical protein Zmor_020413 [Zophobas morio]|uniref:Uncharacterized protein n=1 Tax=Zophobas morio TaxID=2755281 RepID=A0AA38MA11_9CUCU|nr:hypothetical protein Zmor_020413 [Zophobas morio]